MTSGRKPDFNNLLAVLGKKTPSRMTVFELFLNDDLERKLAMWDGIPSTEEDFFRCKITGFANAGYDYTTIRASDFRFKSGEVHKKSSISADEGAVIFDRQSFEEYKWESPRDYYNGRIERTEKYLPDGMKYIVCSDGGVLENTIELTGFTNLCYMVADDPELVGMVVDNVGRRLYEYYEQIIGYDCVGAIISNDDWGFNTQTMLSAEDMRRYIFKWHKKIVRLAHDAGKPVILHSCGNLSMVWDDIIDDMKFDAKHSYEGPSSRCTMS